MADPISTTEYDAVNAAQGELAALQQRYNDWKMSQDQRLEQHEVQLEQLKLQLEKEVTEYAGQIASGIANAQMQVEAYAQAVARAITATENPYTYRGTGQPFSPAPQGGPLSLPS